MTVTALLEYLDIPDCVMQYIKGCSLPFYSKTTATATKSLRGVVMVCYRFEDRCTKAIL